MPADRSGGPAPSYVWTGSGGTCGGNPDFLAANLIQRDSGYFIPRIFFRLQSPPKSKSEGIAHVWQRIAFLLSGPKTWEGAVLGTRQIKPRILRIPALPTCWRLPAPISRSPTEDRCVTGNGSPAEARKLRGGSGGSALRGSASSEAAASPGRADGQPLRL